LWPEAADILGVDFDEDADTLGGWMIAKLGRLPNDGSWTPLHPHSEIRKE
jgi:CBS domain containing-hemolysin-like protein